MPIGALERNWYELEDSGMDWEPLLWFVFSGGGGFPSAPYHHFLAAILVFMGPILGLGALRCCRPHFGEPPPPSIAGAADGPGAPPDLEGAESAAPKIHPRNQGWAAAVLCHQQCEWGGGGRKIGGGVKNEGGAKKWMEGGGATKWGGEKWGG